MSNKNWFKTATETSLFDSFFSGVWCHACLFAVQGHCQVVKTTIMREKLDRMKMSEPVCSCKWLGKLHKENWKCHAVQNELKRNST